MTHHTELNSSGSFHVRTGETFQCQHCGRSSSPAKRPKKDVKYCSRQCSGAAKKVAPRFRDCEGCGRSFQLDSRHLNQKYCSLKCNNTHNVDPDLRITKECPICSQSFTVYKSSIDERTPRNYCSNACRHKAKALNAGSIITPSGGIINSSGYVRITLPNSTDRVYEHRYVMEKHLGRSLVESENVHHINGIRHDNRLENLELWYSYQPQGQRVSDLLAWADEIIATYDHQRDLL